MQINNYNRFKLNKYKNENHKLLKIFDLYNCLESDYGLKKSRVDNIFNKLSLIENRIPTATSGSSSTSAVGYLKILAKNPEGKEIGTIHRIATVPIYTIYNSSGSIVATGNTPVNSQTMAQYIELSAGVYTIKVSFNGINITKSKTIASGIYSNIQFDFVRKELAMYDFIASCYSGTVEPFYQFNMTNSFDGESTSYYIQHMGPGVSQVLLTAKPNGGYTGSCGINARAGDLVLPFLATSDNNGYIQIQIDPPDDWGHFPTMEEYVLGSSAKFHCSTIPYDEDNTAL